MPLDPDTEIQYRRGGKIMKKFPRKFQAGGATPAPSPDRVPPAEAAKMKAEKEQQRREAATQKKGAEKPDLGRLGFKKGGKVKKFGEGDMVTQDTRERRADEKPRAEPAPIENRTSPDAPKTYNRPVPLPSGNEARDAETATNPNTRYGRFDDDTYRKAYAQANRLTTPSGKVEPEIKARTGLKEPSASKPAPKAAPKAATSNPRKAGNDPEPYSRREEQTEPQIGNKSEPKVEPKSRSVEKPDSEKDVTQRIKDSLARTRAGSEGSDSRSVNDRLRAFAKENPNATKALEVGSMFIPAGGLGIAAARAARAAYMAKKARDAGRSAEAATAARRAPRDLDEERMAGEGGPNFKRGGVAKYAKGGGVEAKGKTKGKIVKMAKGGSVRGYGISKVTNKTKIV